MIKLPKLKEFLKNKTTTIAIGIDTYERLTEKGKFGDSIEDIVKRLLDSYEELSYIRNMRHQ